MRYSKPEELEDEINKDSTELYACNFVDDSIKPQKNALLYKKKKHVGNMRNYFNIKNTQKCIFIK